MLKQYDSELSICFTFLGTTLGVCTVVITCIDICQSPLPASTSLKGDTMLGVSVRISSTNEEHIEYRHAYYPGAFLFINIGLKEPIDYFHFLNMG